MTQKSKKLLKVFDRVYMLKSDADGVIPIGATGTIIYVHQDDINNVNSQYQVAWDRSHTGKSGISTYCDEAYSKISREYTSYENCWSIYADRVGLLDDTIDLQNLKQQEIIQKIKYLNERFANGKKHTTAVRN